MGSGDRAAHRALQGGRVEAHSGGRGFRAAAADCSRLSFVRALTQTTCRPTVPAMRAFTAVIERCPDTGLYVGFVPGFVGAHSQGESLDELQRNLREVIEMLLEDGEPDFETEFVGTQSITVAA